MRQLPAPQLAAPATVYAQSQAEQSGRDDDLSFGAVWHVLRRRWPLVLASTLGVLSLAAAYVVHAAPTFEAATSIRVDEKQSNLPVLDVLKSLSNGNEVATEMLVLHSRSLAEMVVDSLGLEVQLVRPRRTPRDRFFTRIRISGDPAPDRYVITRSGRNFLVKSAKRGTEQRISVGEPIVVAGATLVPTLAFDTISSAELVILDRESAIQSLLQSLSISRPDREANLIVATFRSHDYELVQAVPNLLARRFIDARRGVQQTEARSTAKFLREQIDTIGRQLSASEEQLRAFRERAQVVSVADEATAGVTHLADLQAQRTGLDAERSALAGLWAEIQQANRTRRPDEPSPYRRLAGFPSLLRNPATATLLGSLANIEDQRAALLVRRKAADPDVQALDARIEDIEGQLAATATAYLEGLTNQVAAMDSSLNQFSGEMRKIPAKETELARLERQPKVLNEIYELLQTRLKEAEIAEAVEDATVRVIDTAIIPPSAVSPNKPLLLALGLIGGFIIGVVLAFAREHMDRTIHTREDVYAITGLPVLALIPNIRDHSASLSRVDRLRRIAGSFGNPEETGPRIVRWTPPSAELGQRLVAGMSPRSPVAEAFRALRTSLTFSRPDDPVKTIVFTSPMPGDGKTTSAANLAITLAQQGIRTLLIDADMRRGVLNTVLGTEREPGLSNVLSGSLSFEGALVQVDLGEHGSMDFLSTGTLPPNPAELLGSARMRTLIERARDSYEVVILDAPPLNVVTDAAVIGALSDGVVIVARAATTESGALAFTQDLLDQVRVPVLGVILNDIDFKRDNRYSPRYGQYYGYYGQYAKAYAGD